MKMIELIGVVSIAALLSGCSNQNAGTAVGAASGTIIGSSISVVGAGVGLGVGALVGVAVGTVIDNCTKTNDPHNAATCKE
jgi:hypothetical protein